MGLADDKTTFLWHCNIIGRWSADMTLTKLMLLYYLMSSWGRRPNIDWWYAHHYRSVRWLQISQGLHGTGLIIWKFILSMITHIYIYHFIVIDIFQKFEYSIKKTAGCLGTQGVRLQLAFVLTPEIFFPEWSTSLASLDEVTTVIANKQGTICPAGILGKVNWTYWGNLFYTCEAHWECFLQYCVWYTKNNNTANSLHRLSKQGREALLFD